jgi:hypothetical protein
VAITNGYAALNDVKAALRMGTADTADDALLELAIEASSRMIDDECDRVFYASGTAVARDFAPVDWQRVDIDDCITVASVAVDTDHDGTFNETWDAGDYRAVPANNLAGGRPWPTTGLIAIGDRRFYPYSKELTVRVTGTWGFAATVPTEVKNATVLQSLRLFKRYDSPLGIAGFGPDLGAVRVSRVDPDVAAMLSRYRKSKVGTA